MAREIIRKKIKGNLNRSMNQIIDNYKELIRVNYIADHAFNNKEIESGFDKQISDYLLEQSLSHLIKNAAKYAEHLRVNGRGNGELIEGVERLVKIYEGHGYNVEF